LRPLQSTSVSDTATSAEAETRRGATLDREAPDEMRRTRQAKTTRTVGFDYSSWRCVVSWVILIVAGLFETVWALALKESHGFSKLGPSVLFLLTLVISMVLLAIALRDLPVGTGYAVWTGTGAVGAAVGGMSLLNEPAMAGRIIPIGLIAVGIVWLALVE
jgi:quaternary ammonium compound-resistance protein SugE